MNEVISWVVLAGSWLLVAGPLYQGSVELSELDIIEHHDWPAWLFWLLLVALLALAMLNTAARMSGDQRTRRPAVAEAAPTAEQL